MNDDLQRAAAANADAVLRRFFDPDGRLKTLPAKQSRQLAVYDLIAQRFIPGVRYTELEVNRELMGVYDDYVTLRRGLIDFGLMDRADGEYWRSGGTVPVGSSPVTGRSPKLPPTPTHAGPLRNIAVGARRRPAGGDPDGGRATVRRARVRGRRDGRHRRRGRGHRSGDLPALRCQGLRADRGVRPGDRRRDHRSRRARRAARRGRRGPGGTDSGIWWRCTRRRSPAAAG